MPTAVQRSEFRWLVHGPWGRRTFLNLSGSVRPHEAIARELGVLGEITEDAVERILQNRSWNAVQRLWVED